MSDLTLVGIIGTTLQLGLLIVVIWKTLKLMKGGSEVFLPFFFALAMTSVLLSNLYWVAYDTLRPDTRMPIASNEIAECAVVLLLSAGLDSVLKDKREILGEIIFAFLFISVNIVLWIAWSGEWFQDILFGVPYIYFFWLLIRGLRSRKSMTRKELWFSSVSSVFFVITQISFFLVKGEAFKFVEFVSFAVMFVLAIWLGIKSYRSKDFFVAVTFYLWTNLSMFLSTGVLYYTAMLAETITFLLMFVSMKRELQSNGLR